MVCCIFYGFASYIHIYSLVWGCFGSFLPHLSLQTGKMHRKFAIYGIWLALIFWGIYLLCLFVSHTWRFLQEIQSLWDSIQHKIFLFNEDSKIF